MTSRGVTVTSLKAWSDSEGVSNSKAWSDSDVTLRRGVTVTSLRHGVRRGVTVTSLEAVE